MDHYWNQRVRWSNHVLLDHVLMLLLAPVVCYQVTFDRSHHSHDFVGSLANILRTVDTDLTDAKLHSHSACMLGEIVHDL